jgi:2-polyprenyl-3-methyl-5-hydroxy-6-metoxy-1,4-benzoquinol methylase
VKTNQEFNAQKFFSIDLVDLGDIINLDMCGILAPNGDLNSKKIGVTDQFLKNANIYHEKYFNTEYFSYCLSKALSKISFSKDDPYILDIGSGSGNTVLPALDLFKNSRIIATGISENLLYIMKKYLKNNPDYESRVSLVRMDATKVNYYKENMFDIVIDAAILHHLIDPYSCIEAAASHLRRETAPFSLSPSRMDHLY